MRTVGVAEAKARLSELLSDVERGESVEVTRRGKVLARIVPAQKKKLKPIDFEDLRRHLASIKSPPVSTEEFTREWKDDERY